MKKIKSLFVREFGEKHSVKATPIVEPGFEWVLEGEGIATRKRDGTCTKIENGEIFRRYDCKHGKTPPQGFIPADEPDPITEHWPGWLKIDKYNSKGDENFRRSLQEYIWFDKRHSGKWNIRTLWSQNQFQRRETRQAYILSPWYRDTGCATIFRGYS
ncbi:hypothetical protein DXA92_11020 [Agathobaculum butyriciproducens]|nr:hypothetical protein DXA92_11020 [Agathobaculum butyriciproducens]